MSIAWGVAAVGVDGADLGAVLREHIPAMWLLAVRLCGREQAEDVVQEALETAWRRRSTFDADRGTLRTWLLVLVTDRARKQRRRRSWPHVDAELAELPAPSGDSSVEDAMDVDRAVRALAPRQRLAVELFYVLGFPVAECAQVMGCSVGTVSSTLSDARSALRRELGDPDA